MSLDELRSQLTELDAEAARTIDTKNRRRVVRALEICLLTGKPTTEVVVPRRRDDPGRGTDTSRRHGYDSMGNPAACGGGELRPRAARCHWTGWK